jgi:crotonobetainyl-CoA:carnitine CoA-transferase CaiB-like acyl-CoA transferase
MAAASRSPELHPLAGIRIVEAGGGLALRLAGRLLADAGASVVRAPLGDDPLLAQPYGADWAAWLDEGKPVSGDSAADLAVAWLLLTSHPHGSPLGCDTALAQYPRLIAACVTPFGQDGPRAGWPGDDVVAAALSGLADATPGFPDMQATAAGPPVQSLAPLAEAGGAYIAALAAFGALLARLRGAPGPRHVEVSTVEAAAALMVFEWAQHAFGGPIRGRRPDLPELAPNCYVSTADGTAAIVAFTDPHWARLKQLMGSPAWAEDPDFATSTSRGLAWERLRPRLEAWAAAQPGHVLLEAAQAVELPTCCSLRLAETLTSEQVAATGAVVDGRIADPIVLGGRRRRRPAPPRRAALLPPPEPPPEPPPGAAAGPLAGVRVLDLGQVVAGPWAGTMLAALGADVTFVEPPGFPLSRRFGPFVGEPLHDAGAVFSQVSRGKRSVQIDVKSGAGRELLYGLVGTHDVLLENFSRDAAEALGLSYEALRAQRRDIIVASISGFGRQGPWGSYAAFHSGVLLLSGNADVTRDDDGRMRLAGAIYPDFLTGTVTAFAIEQALVLREQTGKGRHLEIAMLDVLLTSMGGLAPAALGGAQFAAHPARFVRDGGDDSGGGGFVVEHAGLRTPVLDIGEVMADKHLRARGFVLAQEHPVSGVRTVAAVPWRYDGVRPVLRHAPLLDSGRGDLPALLAPRP